MSVKAQSASNVRYVAIVLEFLLATQSQSHERVYSLLFILCVCLSSLLIIDQHEILQWYLDVSSWSYCILMACAEEHPNVRPKMRVII